MEKSKKNKSVIPPELKKEIDEKTKAFSKDLKERAEKQGVSIVVKVLIEVQ